MDYAKNTATGQIASGNLGASFRKGEWRLCTNQEIADYELNEVKDFKKQEINSLRDLNLTKTTPQTVGSNYTLEISGENKIFQVPSNLKSELESRIGYLKRQKVNGVNNPTATWIAEDNIICDLTIADFTALLDHVIYRTDFQFKQARLKKDALEALTTVEEIEAFDINEPIV
jgi:hypothetical protein